MPFIKTGPDDFGVEPKQMWKTPNGHIFETKHQAAAHTALEELAESICETSAPGTQTWEVHQMFEAVRSDPQRIILAMLYLSDGIMKIDFEPPPGNEPGQEIAFREIKVNVNK